MPDPAPAPQEPRPLADTERSLLQQRRRLAGVPADAPTVGLALSGGGVRSATFGLGLLRGLAQRGQLPRIDYLSTVSGGGYTGAMFGRLVAMVGILRAQALLSANDSPVLAWLRRNGRYLTPSGSRDIGIAVVTYLRAFIAIHGEFMAVSLPFALLVIGPHLWHTVSTLSAGSAAAASATAWRPWGTLWWPLGAAWWAAAAPGLMTGYWVARESADPGEKRVPVPWRDVAFVALLCVAVAAMWAVARPPLPGLTASLKASVLALLAFSSSAAGLVWAHARLVTTRETRSLAVARLRHRTTFALRLVTLVAAGCVWLGALDLLSWWLLVELQSGERWVLGGIGLGGLGVLVLRSFAQPLLQLSQRTQPGSVSAIGPKLLNAAGLFGFAALVTAWVVGVQWLVFTPEPVGGFDQLTPGARAAFLLALSIVWLLLTAGNAPMANASSLHSFYRARLTRAYLAVGNPARKLADPAPDGVYDVTTVVPGDDTGLCSYQPELAGGPIHLINTCLNQTRDDASGLYNADRKGTLVTASARGFEIGAHGWSPMREDSDSGTLGRWIAVSGAAAAPGAGAYTSRGWALMLYFLGVRLGHWMHAPLPPPPLSALRRWLWRFAIKPVMLWSEGMATFFGSARPWWYLSDGGHFENTGVYALLKRRVDFIVCADCGADKDYDFGDIENLVRKARIDLGAEIEFYTRDEAARLFTLAGTELTVLSPEDMDDNHSSRGVLLARIRYRIEPGTGGAARHEATLLLIKPNLHDALDVDLLAYAQRKAAFPHESTGDQNFDEAQWESYHRLGEDFGCQLHEPWMSQLPGWRRRERHPLTVAARLRGGVVKDAPEQLPWWRRSARATAIGASIGLGAGGTLLLSLWQLQEQLNTNRNNERTEVRRLFTEVSSELKTFDGSCPRLADHTATQLLLLHDLRDSPVLLSIERDGVKSLLGRVRDECAKPPQASADCTAAAERAHNGVCATIAKQNVGDRALSYWAPVPAGRSIAQLFSDWRAGGRATTSAATAPPLPVQEPPGASSPQPVPLGQPGDTGAGENALGAAAACDGSGRPLQLYIQVYDEASRQQARALRRDLQALAGDHVQVAPVEDVARTAALRGTRRPVPWPQPTLLLHDSHERTCAEVLSPLIQRSWSVPGVTPTQVWIRQLPADQTKQERVLELWLPPREDANRNAEFW
ncbi:hypothetical protein [Methylibium sp.]|uniref:hypothetical protein n=1 Tax=Methylibium sp. TaxID=2067992 RepID=UPI003D0A417E